MSLLYSRKSQTHAGLPLTPKSPTNYNILVIDNETDCNYNILNTYGYNVLHLPNPALALTKLATPATIPRPDLILCDLLGDSIDGLDFLRTIREPGYPHVPVMIVTALESNSTFEKAVIDLGADDFVLKPVRTSELLLRVRLLLRGMPGVAAWRAPEML